MAIFYKTQYPFAFVEGANRYDLPFSLMYKKTLSVGDELVNIHIQDSIASGAVNRIKYVVSAITGNVSILQSYYCSQNDANYFTCNWGNIFTSDAEFSITIKQIIEYSDGEYVESTSYTQQDNYTYNNKKTYYRYLEIADSRSNSGTKILGFSGTVNANEMNATDWALFDPNANGRPQNWAWVVLYGENSFVNDPYNRPEQTPAPRGGSGSWDTTTDNIAPDTLPTGNWGKGFVNVYNPSQTELATFGAIIWDETVRTNLNDIFPQGVMAGIVDCFTIPIQPDVSGTGDIVIGGKQLTGLTTNIVSNRFKSVNCGTLSGIDTQEFFGGFPDYSSTKIAIYLPYIGFQQLAPEMVLNCSLSLEYRIDCMTGDCVAILTSTRNDSKFPYDGVSYVFNGNCASKIPLTASTGAGTSDYISTAISGLSGIASGAVSMAMGNPAGAIGAIASGANTINSIMSMSDKIGFQIKGGFSGSKGQLSPQTPYLVINRPVMENGADNEYFQLCGIPSNDYARVEQCFGFTRALECFVTDTNFANATNDEKQEIYNLLKSGVIV